MSTAHSFGRLYFVPKTGQAAGAPFIDRAITVEKEGKMRRGSGILIRLPFTKHRTTVGCVIGVWQK